MQSPADIRRAWRPTSLMASIPDGQQAANIAGRARVDGGVLTPSPATRPIDPTRDARTLDFIVEPGFLPPAQCDRLLRVFDVLHQQTRHRKTPIPFWDGRIVYITDVVRHDPGAAAIMADFQRRTAERLSDVYQLSAPLFTDTVQLNIWEEGQCLPPHVDNANPGGEPHPSYWRDFSSIVYLNDDYEGGELYFTAQDRTLRPRKGMLVAFSAGYWHEHGVLTVTRGRRIAMPAFYTFWPRKADATVHPETQAVGQAEAPLPPAALPGLGGGPRWTPPKL